MLWQCPICKKEMNVPREPWLVRCCGVKHSIGRPQPAHTVVQLAEKGTRKECLYRGHKVSDIDCQCGGLKTANHCHYHNENCIVHAISKPWVSVKSTPHLDREPRSCATCKEFAKTGDDLKPVYPMPRPTGRRLHERTSDRLVLVMPCDDWSKNQYEISGPAIERYAKRCNADLRVVTDDAFPWFPMLNKWRIHQYAAWWQQTLYVDCDVLIRDDAPDIFDQVPVGEWGCVDESRHITNRQYYSDMQAVAERYGYDCPSWCPNAGVLLIPQQCDEYRPPQGPMPSQWCFDQSWLACRLQSHVELDNRFNWMAIQEGFSEGLDSAWFVHLNGTTKKDRIDRMRNIVGLSSTVSP